MFGQMSPRLRPPGKFCGIRAVATAVQSINNVANTAVTFNSITQTGCFKTHASMHDIATNNSRIYVPAGMGGIYTGMFGGAWATSNINARILKWYKNGSVIPNGSSVAPASVGTTVMQCTLAPYLFAEGDYVEAFVLHSKGAALNFGSNAADEEQAVMTFWRLAPPP